MPRDRNGWRVAPAPDGRGAPEQHRPKPLHRLRGFWPLDLELARQTYLDVFIASMFAAPLAGGNLIEDISYAAHLAPTPREPRRPSDVLLEGLSVSVTDGRAAPAPILSRVARTFAEGDIPLQEGLRWGWAAPIAALMLWDEQRWHAILARQLESAREAGVMKSTGKGPEPIDQGPDRGFTGRDSAHSVRTSIQRRSPMASSSSRD
ncbi:MAG: hypothetical protein ACLP8S_21250 [Solirubrobacteraceae bacterium]